MKVPSVEQEEMLTAMGIDHRQYGVRSEDENTLRMKHYKTGNEIRIEVNRRCSIDNR